MGSSSLATKCPEYPGLSLRYYFYIYFYLKLVYYGVMARKPRILISDGIYHIYNRANNRRSINFASQTFDCFLGLLKDIKVQFDVDIFAYCLMKNHYHIFLRTKRPNLDEVMKYFGENYAKYINYVTNGNGSVFSGRYNAKIVLEDAYFLQVLRYIHLNPVESGTVGDFLDYDWSSAKEYGSERFKVVSPDLINDYFLNFDDFVSYHRMGNTREILSYYSRKNVPNRLHSRIFEKSLNLM